MEFKIGDRVKLNNYNEYCDYRDHYGKEATILSIENNHYSIKWDDGHLSDVYKNSAYTYLILISSEGNSSSVNNKMQYKIFDVLVIDKNDLKIAVNERVVAKDRDAALLAIATKTKATNTEIVITEIKSFEVEVPSKVVVVEEKKKAE